MATPKLSLYLMVVIALGLHEESVQAQQPFWQEANSRLLEGVAVKKLEVHTNGPYGGSDWCAIILNGTDQSRLMDVQEFVEQQGGHVAMMGSPRIMLGWIAQDVVSHLIGRHGIVSVQYKPMDLRSLGTLDKDTYHLVRFFNSSKTDIVDASTGDQQKKRHAINPIRMWENADALPHPDRSEKNYTLNLAQKGINVSEVAGENRPSQFSANLTLIAGNSDVMVGTVAVALFFVQSNGAIDPEHFAWTDRAQDSVYQLVMRDLTFWSAMAQNYGKSLSFLLVPYYHDNPACQQPYEPDNRGRYPPNGIDSLWMGAVMNGLGFTYGDYLSRMDAFNTWLRVTDHTDEAYSVFFSLCSTAAQRCYAYLGGPCMQIWVPDAWNAIPFHFGDVLDGIVAHETGHIFWAVDEYNGCDGITTRSGLPNGNPCSENMVPCIMLSPWPQLCSFTAAHVGWTNVITQYHLITQPSGLLAGVEERGGLTFRGQKVSPQAFPWARGSSATLFVGSPQVWNRRKYQFDSWSDGGTQSHQIVTSGDTTYIANFSEVGESVQNWIVYQQANSGLPSNDIHAVSIDKKGEKWIATANGLARFDGVTWTVYNETNSSLPSNIVLAIAIDSQGVKWIGTLDGLAKFDGATWTVFNNRNSGLPDNYISLISIDPQGNKWVGTGTGLAKFDGASWTVYTSNNSTLPDGYCVTVVAFDPNSTVWVGSWNGLSKFDGSRWILFNQSNSLMPTNSVNAIWIDANGNKWIATSGGLVKFDGTKWTTTISPSMLSSGICAVLLDQNGDRWLGNVAGLAKYDGISWKIFDDTNSMLPEAVITGLALDSYGRKWIGMAQCGIAVFREGDVLSNLAEGLSAIPGTYRLLQNYPNPFNPSTTIRFSIPKAGPVSLKIYNLLGEEISTLVSERLQAGTHSVQWNALGIPSGVYFYRLQAGDFTGTKKLLLLR